MVVLSVLAFPLTLLEYFYTKERITLEGSEEKSENINYASQLKAIFTDKYMVIIYLYFLIYTCGTSFKNVGLVYFCNYVLGSYNDGVTQTMVSVIGGIPMGIGIFAVWPLAKKFGKRNVTLAGFILYAAGSAVCWLNPKSMTVVLVGQFIKNIGGLPCAYVFMALFADVLDHVEWKTGIRCDGAAMSINNIIAVSSVGVCTGIFNLMLGKLGYIAPELVNGETIAVVQNTSTQNFISFSFIGLEVFTGAVLVALLFFLNVEKGIEDKQKEILARKGINASKE